VKLRAALILAALALSGCVSHPVAPTTRPAIYTGPTDPLDVLLAKINANNSRIATVVASGTFDANLGKEQRYLNGQVTLLHTKPDKLLLKLKKDIAADIFTAGNNGERWWVIAAGDIDTTYYGTPQRAASGDPRIPISPELIADVLGVATLSLDMLAQPVPTMRFNPDYDCYMLTWHVPITDRWVTLREVWYDRESLQPKMVWLFDRNGRVALRAKLGNVQPMDVTDGDAAAAPKVARSYDLFFPENNSRLTLRFDEVRATRKGAPNAQTYRFDPARVTTAKVVNLDDAAPAN
jgi:hypothetical protein